MNELGIYIILPIMIVNSMAQRSSMNPELALQTMQKTLDQQIGMPDADWSLMLQHMSVIEVPKKTLLQNAGERSLMHHFIVEGLVRYYYLDLEGKEHNKAFYDKGHIAGSLSAIILEEPARFSIETGERHLPNYRVVSTTCSTSVPTQP